MEGRKVPLGELGLYFVLCTFLYKSTKYKVQFPREKCGVGGREGGGELVVEGVEEVEGVEGLW